VQQTSIDEDSPPPHSWPSPQIHRPYRGLGPAGFPTSPAKAVGQDVSLSQTHNYRTHLSCQPARRHGAVLARESDVCPKRQGLGMTQTEGVDAGGKGSNDPR